MLESLVGVTYNDDCWFLGLTFLATSLSSGDVEMSTQNLVQNTNQKLA